MSDPIREYLESLKQAMGDSDPALVQDALADAEARLRTEAARLRWNFPDLQAPEDQTKAIETFGTAQEAAQRYRSQEAIVFAALSPKISHAPRHEEPVPPMEPELPEIEEEWPGFLEVFSRPRAYTSLLYLLLSMATGIVYFTWMVTGLSLSLGLLIVWVGFPLLVLVLGSARALGLGEGRLVEALLGVRMPRRQPLIPEGSGFWNRLGNLFKDGYTWTSVCYLMLQMVLGCAYFGLMVALLSASLGLLSLPFVHYVFHQEVITGWTYWEQCHPVWLLPLGSLAGFLLLAGTLHLSLALGRFHGMLAKALLVKR